MNTELLKLRQTDPMAYMQELLKKEKEWRGEKKRKYKRVEKIKIGKRKQEKKQSSRSQRS